MKVAEENQVLTTMQILFSHSESRTHGFGWEGEVSNNFSRPYQSPNLIGGVWQNTL
ncbi:hypothetical protein PQG02_20290 [Nostoc sp. UHCC 0926]|uniref:hypothetical protein n=1 Tax=unclassified Nostoc TaxID=2593658 RepID=UPI0023605F81|nr:hypothetical protein [Nostoc sp. UHCC 0926]WDD31061.1 hypothetical protein PQG02_20290 [Nostoc sp. UHCC 0926]